MGIIETIVVNVTVGMFTGIVSGMAVNYICKKLDK